jgi:hypothetical protein
MAVANHTEDASALASAQAAEATRRATEAAARAILMSNKAAEFARQIKK